MKSAIELMFIIFLGLFCAQIINSQNYFYPLWGFSEISIPAKPLEPTMREWVISTLQEAKINIEEADKIIQCESSWDPNLIHHNLKGMGMDRGLWQLSDKFHPEITNVDAFSYKASTLAAIKLYKQNNSWSPWVCAQVLGLTKH